MVSRQFQRGMVPWDFYGWRQRMLENLMESSQRVYILVHDRLHVFPSSCSSVRISQSDQLALANHWIVFLLSHWFPLSAIQSLQQGWKCQSGCSFLFGKGEPNGSVMRSANHATWFQSTQHYLTPVIDTASTDCKSMTLSFYIYTPLILHHHTLPFSRSIQTHDNS